MLSRIQKINGPALLKNFSWPSAVREFSKRNLIYGWNGTGKTSLAEVLRSLETREKLPGVEFSLQASAGTIRSDSLAACHVPVRVFTRSFVDENVFAGTMRPIVYLGSSNIAKKQEIDELAEELRKLDRSEQSARTTLQQAESALQRHGTQVGKTIKNLLLGAHRYQNYDRRNYLSRRNELKRTNWQQKILSEEELAAHDKDRHADAKPDVSWKPSALPSLESLCREVDTALQREVVATAIESLKQDPAAENWCNQGLELHLERRLSECVFCTNAISPERMQQLQDHFSTSYQSLQDDLSSLIRRLDEHDKSAADAGSLPSAQDFYDSLQGRYDLCAQNLREAVSSYRDYIAVLKGKLEAKKRSPMSALAEGLEPPSEVDVNKHLREISQLVEEHKRKSSVLSDETAEACRAIEDHHVAGAMDEHDRLDKALKDAKEVLSMIQEKAKILRSQVGEIQASITPHAESATEMNRDLERYLGHDDLRFEVAEDGYRVVRREEADAKGLSEGEKTAIALLYFLQTLKSDDLDLPDCVVVLDDPVSSLDANALFNAFSFIQEKTRNAQQLFILTHSFPFFRLVRRWLRFGEKGSESSFYSLRARVDEEGNRYAELSNLDDLLLLFESEYHYLFHLVESAANSPEDQPDLNVYHLPNTARRLLEAFVSFAKPTRKGGLKAALPALDPQGSRAIRILSFTNVLSHNEDFESSSDQDMSSLAEARSAMADVMDFIRETAEDHYEEMMRLLAESRSASLVRGSSLQSRQ